METNSQFMVSSNRQIHCGLPCQKFGLLSSFRPLPLQWINRASSGRCVTIAQASDPLCLKNMIELAWATWIFGLCNTWKHIDFIYAVSTSYVFILNYPYLYFHRILQFPLLGICWMTRWFTIVNACQVGANCRAEISKCTQTPHHVTSFKWHDTLFLLLSHRPLFFHQCPKHAGRVNAEILQIISSVKNGRYGRRVQWDYRLQRD